MGHQICALISKLPIDETKVRAYSLAVAFESEFAIVILDEDSIDYWEQELGLSSKSQSSKIEWACELVFHFAKELNMQQYALIQTDYFAGMGEQSASLYEDGKLILEHQTINAVLAKLGVERTLEKDEFDVLNLGEYHASENFYWDSHNFADLKDHMIAGRIPKKN